MNIEQFMRGYKAAWEGRDESLFCALFASDGIYHNTPFAEQRGHVQLAQYWQRVKLQDGISVTYGNKRGHAKARRYSAADGPRRSSARAVCRRPLQRLPHLVA